MGASLRSARAIGDPLALSAESVTPALAHLGVVAPRQLADELMRRAAFAAASTLCCDTSASPYAMFARTVSLKRKVSCGPARSASAASGGWRRGRRARPA